MPLTPLFNTIPQFNGAIVTNATPGQTMNIQNVTITGPAAGFSLCNTQRQRRCTGSSSTVRAAVR